MRIQRGVRTPPLNNHNNIGFLSNPGQDSLKNYEATELIFECMALVADI